VREETHEKKVRPDSESHQVGSEAAAEEAEGVRTKGSQLVCQW
jgi:hypothetical protein